MPEEAVGLTDLNVDQFVWHYCWRRVQPWGNLLGFLEFKTGKVIRKYILLHKNVFCFE